MLFGVALAAAACLAVLAVTGGELATRRAGPLPGWVRDRAVAQLQGRLVTDADQAAAGRWPGPARYTARVAISSVEARGRRTSARVPMLVIGGPAWAGLTAGSTVSLVGRLVPAEPGDDVVALVSALGEPRSSAPGAWWWRAADRVRAGLRQAVAGLPAAPAGLLPSLVVGDTSTLSPAVEADLRTSGLTHLTAVSGANVAIVVGALLWVTVLVGLRRRWRLVVAGLGVAGFVILARPEPSVVRAAAMGAVALSGLAAGRRPRGVPALAASIVVLLVVNPWLARSAGFALSAAATAALLLLAPPWAARLGRRMPYPLAVAVAAPAAAQAVCAPLVVLLTPAVSLVAVPANLLAGPAVAPATVLGVVAALLSVVWPAAAHPVAAVGCLATWWITEVASHAARLPAASLPWLPGVSGALALAVPTAAFIVVTVRGAHREPGAPPPRQPRPPRPPRRARPQRHTGWFGSARVATVPAALIILAVLAAAIGWALWPLMKHRLPSGVPGSPAGVEAGAQWVVAQCDVGQGDAMAVRSGPDRAVLIDVGPDPAAIDECLRDLGVHHLDLIVLTHFHADHVAGLPGALRRRDAGGLLVSPLAQPEPNAAQVNHWAAGASVPVAAGWAGRSGQTGANGWQLAWRLLLPDASTVGSAAGGASPGAAVMGGSGDGGQEEGSIVNEASLVTLLDVTTPQGRHLRVIGLGDLEVPGQEHLESLLAAHGFDPLGPGVPPGIDVVKVAHHGSAKQDDDLYRRLAPQVALIGVGADNDYGHPAAAALTLLAAQRIPTYRTDRQGTVKVYPGADGTILVTTSR